MGEMKNVGDDARKLALILMENAARNVDHDDVVTLVWEAFQAAGLDTSDANLVETVDRVKERIASGEVAITWDDDQPSTAAACGGPCCGGQYDYEYPSDHYVDADRYDA